MINVSSEFSRLMQEGRPFVYSAEIKCLDGRTVSLTEDDLSATGCHISISAGTSSFPVGNALSRILTLSFFNYGDQYMDYDFFGAVITVAAELELGETAETLDLGTFTVTEPEEYGTTVQLVGYDNFYKADRKFTANVTLPITAGNLFVACCQLCGFSLTGSDFRNNNYVIKNIPEDISCRQVFGCIAMVAGGNAVVKGNSVRIMEYNFAQLSNTDGGIFDTASPYATGANADGMEFSPWSAGRSVSGGYFTQQKTMQVMSDVISQTICTDDVVITGISIKTDGEEYLEGTDDYALAFTNELTEGNEQAAADIMAECLVGLSFRPFELTTPSYPLAEYGDVIYLINKGSTYVSYVTDIDFAFKGITTLKCSADSPVRNSSKDYVAQTETYRKLRKQLLVEKSAREVAVEELGQRLDTASGLYSTVEDTGEGNIFYLHDKPELSNSLVVWKMTQEAFGVSSDGGVTWNAGLTVDGVLIAQILDTIGINFDWGVGGTLVIKDQNGTETLYADAATGVVRIRADSFMLANGQTVQDIAGTAADGALESAKNYTDNLNNALNQAGVLSRLLGTGQGMVIENGQLYMSFTYAKGGTLTLGGNGNGNGRLVIVNSAGTQIGYIDNTGVNFNQGRFKGTISAATIEGSDITGGNIDGAVIQSNSNNRSMWVDGGTITLQDWRAESGYEEAGAIGTRTESWYDTTADPWVEHTVGALQIRGDYFVSIRAGGSVVMNGYRTEGHGLAVMEYVRATQVNSTRLSVTGTKNRLIQGTPFGDLYLHSYETPTPMFGDIGFGQVDSAGECMVALDAVFREAVSKSAEYAVFLQKEGQGDVWVDSKEPAFFVVKGTPGLKFSWEIKAVQRDYETYRMDTGGDLPDDSGDLARIFAGELEAYDGEIFFTEVDNEGTEGVPGN